MDAVSLRLRAELRFRWRSWIGLVVLVGVAGGAVLAGFAGARRTETSYERFLVRHNAAHLILYDDNSGQTPAIPIDRVLSTPEIQAAARGSIFYVNLGPGVGAIAHADDALGTTVNRFKLLEGRLPDPTRVDEALIGFELARQFGLRIGSTFSLFDEESAALAEQMGIDNVTFEVVGIEASPAEFPPLDVGSPLVHLTPAAHRHFRDVGFATRDSLWVRLHDGIAVERFRRAVDRITGPVYSVDPRDHTATVQRSIDLLAFTLRILAALATLVVALVAGQAIARLIFLESDDHHPLRALGMTRAQLISVGVAKVGIIALAASVVAIGVAVSASPLFPVGLARIAEPTPGVAIDAGLLALGVLGLVLLVVAISLVPLVRATRPRAAATRTSDDRPSRIAGVVASAARPSLVAGVRLALQRGGGRTAVPVRTSVAAVTIGVAALVGAFGFAASLSRFVSTPELYGERWNLIVTNFGEADWSGSADVIADIEGIDAFMLAETGVPLRLDDRVNTGGLAIARIHGDIAPPVLDGRLPRRFGEIALATKTMRVLGKQIGDRVGIGVEGGPRDLEMTIVGRVVVPGSIDVRLGEGAVVNTAGAPDEFQEASEVVLRLAAGADRDAVLASLSARLPESEHGPIVVPLPPATPADVVNFGRVEAMPYILGGILALLAAGTLAHVLVSAVHRRRRDLSVLKTIGFHRRQVAATVWWQAITLAGVSLAIAVPLGVVAGRLAWLLFADRQGIVAEPIVALPAVLISVPAGIALAWAIAALPARAAARIHPAVVLRSE